MQASYVSAVMLEDGPLPREEYWANLPAVLHLKKQGRLVLPGPVTFIVGENGAGKSTLLEAVAVACGFNPEGGTINFNFASRASHSSLHNHIRLVRTVRRPRDGFFLRAESLYNAASYMEEVDSIPALSPPIIDSYGGISLHEQSHGESFMSLVLNRFGGSGLYILDEPEAALSPSRQLALLAAIHGLVQKNSQFIISTHSPILMTYPGATVYQLNEEGICDVPYQQTEHFMISKAFLNAPQRTLNYLLEDN